jgi:hypothetical protein
MVFVFQFGFETPQQAAANDRHGWDDESSEYFVIDAPDKQSALAWGCELAEGFVRELGGTSWHAGSFANWVESISDCPSAVTTKPVKAGERPDAAEWQHLRARWRVPRA